MAENSNKFFKTLDDALHRCFSKIRIKTKSTKQVPCEIQSELDLVSKLKECIKESKCMLGKQICITELEKTEEKITKIMSDRNFSLVNQQISQLSSPTDGSFKQTGLWKVKSKILPRPQDPPMAKRDAGGNLVTAPLPLKKLYIETYKKRLEHRKMKSDYKDIYELKTLLWELRFNEIKQIKSSPWKVSNLLKTLKGLNNSHSRDPSGLSSTLFKPGIAGQDLIAGLLDLINGIKTNLFIPDIIKLANITTILNRTFLSQ